MKKLIGFIANNFVLKIVSVLIAIFIWYMVVYYNDPVLTNSYQVHIEVTNESYIENGKQVYRIEENYKTVTVYLSGNRSSLENVTADDITVTADLTQIVDLDREPIMVPLTASCKGFDQSNIKLSRETIPISIENVASKELKLSVLTTDSGAVNNNFEVGTLTPNPSTLTVYGPESVINSIESAAVRIDVNGLSASSDVSGELVMYDASQNEISESIIDDDITFEGGKPDVTVHVELWKKRTNITLDVEYSGEPAYGYEITNISTTPDKLTVAGTDEALKELETNGNKITIPPGEVDVSGAIEDFSREIDITSYLPKDIKLSSSMDNIVIAYVSVMPYGSTEIKFNVDDITVNNMASNLSLVYNTQEVLIAVTGSQGDVSKLDASQISASIDLTGLTAGEHTVPINVTLPDGYELVNNISITVKLTAV